MTSASDSCQRGVDSRPAAGAGRRGFRNIRRELGEADTPRTAVVAGGRLMSGAIGGAGELGHIPVVPGGRPCACGQCGCVEAYASGSSVLARYRQLGGTLGSTTEIAAATAVDHAARRVWADAIDALAVGIIVLTAVVDPALVVLGGGVARAGAVLLDPLGRVLASRLTWRAAPELSLCVLGSRAGLVGAGLLAWARPVRAARRGTSPRTRWPASPRQPAWFPSPCR